MANKLWTGPDDLSIKLWTTWDNNNFYIAASVKDDTFIQEQSGMTLWAGDGFQLAFDTLNDAVNPDFTGVQGYAGDDYEYGIALTKDGIQAYCWIAAKENKSQERSVLNFTPVIIHPDPQTTNYEWAIPWSKLSPAKPVAGNALGINFSYADLDKAGEEVRYWMGITPGICNSKNPAAFKTFILTD